MKLLLIESNPNNKQAKDFVLSPCTTPRGVYDSKGIIQYLTRNKIVANHIIHTIHTNEVKASDGMC